ncbi:VanZ family protein [Microaerobacter geothermalis]|uniref:VanZ family protein n=1 Tax=Microaerobacter geothermalis TaxID=674972 RepID=UPI001F2C70C3|nr:VanZ family protein [Microaerobacter geothermalis]MCF6094110.1 VanZ family protein [Microaerobacter geothermalis]
MWLRWIPSVIWMSVIYYLSSRTGGELQSMFPFFTQFDWGHLIAYFILGLLFYYALWPKREKKWVPFVVVFLSFLYGITDEWHQSFVPSRSPDLFDLMNDTIGAALAVITVRFWKRKI